MRNVETSIHPVSISKQWILLQFSHPLGPTFLFGSLAIGMAAWALMQQAYTWKFVTLCFVSGVFYWTLLEYLLHRFIFHIRVKEPWRRMISGLHTDHHRDTEIKYLIIAPPLVSLLFSILPFLSLWALTQSYATALLILSGVYMGYVIYEWCHYGSHRYAAYNRVWRYIKHYHLLHHFKNPRGTFGVTSPLWDFIFGTMYQPKAKEASCS